MNATDFNHFCANGHRAGARPGASCPVCGGGVRSRGRRAQVLRWIGSFAAFVALVAVMAAVLSSRAADTSNPLPPEGVGSGPAGAVPIVSR